jgi:SAM-dependent methyltransferase
MPEDWYEIAFGRVYPAVYAHRDETEAVRVAARLAPLVGTSSPVLDVACGSGRYLTAFAQAGLEMFGVDLSEYLLAQAASRRGLGERLVRCDMRALPFRGGVFAAALNMFTSFAISTTDLDNLRVIHEIGRVLRRWNLPARLHQRRRRASRCAGGVATPHGRRHHDEPAGWSRGRTLAKRVVYRPAGRAGGYVSACASTVSMTCAMLESGGMNIRQVCSDYDLGPLAASERLLIHSERMPDR